MTAILGMMGSMAGNAMQQGQTMDLVNQQMENQYWLNEQGQQNSKEMWDYTSANQRKHLENQGLNVGLMYSGKGGGGATSNVASGGNAPSAQAPKSNVVEGMIMGMQNAVMESQIKLNEANAENALAEAKKKSGVDTDLTAVQGELARWDLSIKEAQGNDVIKLVQMQANKMEEDWRIAQGDRKVNDATIETQINQAKEDMLKTINDKLLSSAKYDQVVQDIENSIAQLNINSKNADTNEKRMLNDKFMQDAQIKLQKAGLDLQETKMWVDGVTRVVGMGVNVGTRGLMGNTEELIDTYNDGEGSTSTRRVRKKL